MQAIKIFNSINPYRLHGKLLHIYSWKQQGMLIIVGINYTDSAIYFVGSRQGQIYFEGVRNRDAKKGRGIGSEFS